jgi:hypothetical protein
METLFIFAIGYVALGAALFSHPPAPAQPDDFHWKNQIAVFRASLPIVLIWPVALYRFALAQRR